MQNNEEEHTEEEKRQEEEEAKRREEECKARERMVKQYMALKAKHPDAVMLFRTGDFYECYKGDAQKAAKILDITLHSISLPKQGKIEYVTFPHQALDTYLPKLISAGERVAICDQPLEPKQKQQNGQKAEAAQQEKKEEEQRESEEVHHGVRR